MSPMRTNLSRFSVLSLAALLVVAVCEPSRAAMVVTVNPSVAAAGGTGSFDVIISSTSGTSGVGGFSLELTIPSNSGVKFTGVSTATAALPYLFGTLQMPPLTFNAFPTTDVTASDSDAAVPGFVNVTPANSFGLEHVTYSVAAGTAAGPVNVTIVGLTGLAPTSQIDNVNGTPITFTAASGAITVTSVPEPSALIACVLGSIGCVLRRRRPELLAS